jgi:hypothetical protein
MPNAVKLKTFAESGVKELQFLETPPAVIRRTLRLIESVVARTGRPVPMPANDDRPVSPQWGARPLNDSETGTLAALIAYQADQAGWTPGLIAQAVECTFDVERIADLQAWQFDEAVRYVMRLGEQP